MCRLKQAGIQKNILYSPQLTYRDVMHIIVRTSRNNFAEFKDRATGFFTNAANFTGKLI